MSLFKRRNAVLALLALAAAAVFALPAGSASAASATTSNACANSVTANFSQIEVTTSGDDGLTGCAGQTDPATDVTSSSATLHARVSCAKNESGNWWWRWRKDTGAWQEFHESPYACSDGLLNLPVARVITGLAPGAHYTFQVCGQPNGFNPFCANADGILRAPDDSPAEPTDAFDTVPLTQTWTCGWGTFLVSNLPSGCWRPYSDTSFVNTPLPANPQLLSNSATIVSNMMSPNTGNGDGTVRALQPIPAAGNDYNHPYFFNTPTDPLYTISCTRNCNLAGQNLNGAQVRIPCGARPADGTDHHLAVLDQTTGLAWDFWNVQTNLTPCVGGTMVVGLAGNGPISGDGRNTCANAVCVGLTAGIVRQQELAAGSIGHALFIVTKTCNGTTVYPGWDSNNCGGINPTAPAEAQWFRLNLTPAQIQALAGIADWQKTILTAMSVYGMFVGDQGSNGAFELQAESPKTYMNTTNPWHAWAQAEVTKPNNHISYNGTTLALNLTSGLPVGFWAANLQVVDPCVIARAC